MFDSVQSRVRMNPRAAAERVSPSEGIHAMMNFQKLSAVVLAIAVLGTSALAQKPLGAWKGHVEMTMPPLPAGAPPAQAQFRDKMIDQVRKTVIHLTFKAGNKYSLTADMAPGSPSAKARSDEGSWTQSGRTITLKSTKSTASTPPLKGNISADGKSLVLTASGSGGASARLTFVRA